MKKVYRNTLKDIEKYATASYIIKQVYLYKGIGNNMRLKKKNLHLDQTIAHDVLQHYGFRKLASGALVSAIIGTFS